MSADRRVALSWYWPQTLQQVRIEGRVRVLGDDESDRLFEARPRAARAAAIVSHQSAPLASEDELLTRVRADRKSVVEGKRVGRGGRGRVEEKDWLRGGWLGERVDEVR